MPYDIKKLIQPLKAKAETAVKNKIISSFSEPKATDVPHPIEKKNIIEKGLDYLGRPNAAFKTGAMAALEGKPILPATYKGLTSSSDEAPTGFDVASKFGDRYDVQNPAALTAMSVGAEMVDLPYGEISKAAKLEKFLPKAALAIRESEIMQRAVPKIIKSEKFGDILQTGLKTAPASLEKPTVIEKLAKNIGDAKVAENVPKSAGKLDVVEKLPQSLGETKVVDDIVRGNGKVLNEKMEIISPNKTQGSIMSSLNDSGKQSFKNIADTLDPKMHQELNIYLQKSSPESLEKLLNAHPDLADDITNVKTQYRGKNN